MGLGVAHPTEQEPAPRLQPLSPLAWCFLPRLLVLSAPLPAVAAALGGACTLYPAPISHLVPSENARNPCFWDKSPSDTRSNLTPPEGPGSLQGQPLPGVGFYANTISFPSAHRVHESQRFTSALS